MSLVDFCPDCEVSLDLHDDEDACEGAAHKARMLEIFYRAVMAQ